MSYSIGQGGHILAGSGSPATVCVKQWSATWDHDPQDVTTTCSNHFRDRIYGVKSLELTFTGFYDQADHPLTLFMIDSTIHLVAMLGETLSKIEANFVIQSVKVDNPATEAITFEVTALSTGEITVTESP